MKIKFQMAKADTAMIIGLTGCHNFVKMTI